MDQLDGSVARTPIELWIIEHLGPERSTTAELTYERMESQSGECLPVIYGQLDHTKRAHWLDTAIVGAFAEAVRGARSVLDIGPGDGWPSLRMADRFERIVGVDPSPRRVRVQRENAARLGITNVEFLEMDACTLDFADGSFGGVTAASSIEQTDDPERALREVFRVLEPGGTLAMVFEDYDTYFPESAGDEELWTEMAGPVVFYQTRTKRPARETKYGLFLDANRLAADRDLESVLRGLEQDPARLENLNDGEDVPSRPESLGVPFFERLAPCVTSAKHFELSHLTSESLHRLLAEIGFADVRDLDYRMPGLRSLFDAAEGAGRLGDLALVFEALSDVFGAAEVLRARPGGGGFTIAAKP